MAPPEGEPLVRVLDDHLDQDIADDWALFDSGSEDDEPEEAEPGEQCPVRCCCCVSVITVFFS